MNVTATQRDRIIASAFARGAAVLDAHSAGKAAGPTMNVAKVDRPEGVFGWGITAANYREVGAAMQALADDYAQQKRNGPPATARPRPAAPVAARATITRAPRTDADKAAVIASTWATLRARQQGAGQ